VFNKDEYEQDFSDGYNEDEYERDIEDFDKLIEENEC